MKNSYFSNSNDEQSIVIKKSEILQIHASSRLQKNRENINTVAIANGQ